MRRSGRKQIKNCDKLSVKFPPSLSHLDIKIKGLNNKVNYELSLGSVR